MDRETEGRITGLVVSLSTKEKYGGTDDPLYLGIICSNNTAREFPLRYQRSGTALESGKSYAFGFGVVDGGIQHAWDSTGAGKNGLEHYPLKWDEVSRVYIRKEPKKASKDDDDAAILNTIDVVIFADHEITHRKRHYGNVYLDALKVDFYLGNEFGASLDLFKRH